MLSAVLTVLLSVLAPGGPTPAPREFRGVWVATVDHIDWPPRDVLEPEKQRERLIAILDEAQRLHMNAVIFQVRPQADALYSSRLEPWSEYLTGAQGRAPQPFWDPLEFAVWEAHLRGLELHAWFNPYRVWHPAAKNRPASNYLGYTHPNWVRSYGKFQWMDPGEKGVQEWSQDVILDVVRRYDIDGVHLDDYFYPYTIRDAQKRSVPFPDDASYNAYIRSGGRLNRADWRRKNVDDFVSTLYHRIKETKRWVKFGISPFGIYRPGYPASIKAGVDQYAELYADPVKWLANGWCDYLTPQLYWPIAQTAQSYPVLLRWWAAQNPLHRHLWIGNFASQVSMGWRPEELLNQIHLSRITPGVTGNIMYSMAPFMKNSKGIDQKLVAGPYANPTIVPASPWLKNTPPKAPFVGVRRTQEGQLLTMKKESLDTYQWVLYLKRNGTWRFDRLLSADRAALLLAPKVFGGGIQAVGVSAMDRYGNESATRVVGT
jgi:uncharacterized lipoprotein YddW (UPF0748 family)